MASTVHSFTFNPFQENMYIVYDETKQCVIFDPGCYEEDERLELVEFIEKNELRPVKLINTHGHIDHMLGNSFVAGKYGLKLEMHEADIDTLLQAPVYGQMWGIHPQPSPEPSVLLNEGDVITFGNTKLEVLFTPGHSRGSISFYNKVDSFVISGDVLFYGSIGRTDLPGGDFDILAKSIKEKLYTLPENTVVYSGHGPQTSIGKEKKTNPFVKG